MEAIMSELYGQDFALWLDGLATQPLPGGVAAAAVAAAMGAALCAKAARITLERQTLTNIVQAKLEDVYERAQVQKAALLRLAGADEAAYRALMDVQALATQQPGRNQAWQAATEVPIRIAEACRSLLDEVSALESVCRPGVRVDYEIGVWLLEIGQRAGQRAAEVNLRSWGYAPEARLLRLRLDALQEGDLD
jgi:formiminotetrahydrofolate cyclodeaminase